MHSKAVLVLSATILGLFVLVACVQFLFYAVVRKLALQFLFYALTITGRDLKNVHVAFKTA